MEAKARKLAIFKIEVTPYSPSEDWACPWSWECAGDSPVAEFCSGGSGISQRNALTAALCHAEGRHGVKI